MKSKHINWTLGLRCDHRFDLCHDLDLEFSRSNIEFAISQPKMVRLPRNEKQTYRLNSKAPNVTIRFDLDHNLDLWIFKVKRDLDLWPHTWPWPWIFMVKFWNSCISEWEGRLTLHKGGGSMSFMTMIMTIWWPRSGVWIYQIVTGVTSVVGVPSTHLLLEMFTPKYKSRWIVDHWSTVCDYYIMLFFFQKFRDTNYITFLCWCDAYSLTHSLTHSLLHSLLHSLIHSLTNSLTHSLPLWTKY